MSPSASPPTRVRQGESPDFQRRANAFLDVARDEDIWSVSESEESDGSESDASSSYDTDEWSGSDFSASQVDLPELEALIARLHARGAEFVRPKTTQKHRDIHSLVAAAPRARRPTIIPRGSIPHLPDPVICSLHSEGIKAQREGLSWMKPPGPKGGAAERTDAKRKRRADSSPSDDDEARTERRKTKRKKRRMTETEAYLDRVANASRPLSEADRKRRGLEIQYAQQIAALRDAEASDDDSDSDVAATASAPGSPSFPELEYEEAQGKNSDGSGALSTRDPRDLENPEKDPEEEKTTGRVLLTVCWRARTRARSGVQPTPISSVLVDVLPGETCMRFMGRMVRMPPGGVYVRDTQLSWGDCILDPMQELGGARTGPWELDLRREKPFELVLRVPVGAALAHRALREAAGEPVDDAFARGRDDDDERVFAEAFAEADVKRESRVKGKGGTKTLNAETDAARAEENDSRASHDGSSGASGSRSGSRRRHRDEHVFAASVKDLSNRALHPGRTDPKGMAALLRAYGAIKDDASSSLVDVGSGDGQLALGLARAFPNAGVCGIEAQKDLYEESLRVAGRDCNFIHGLAEKELARCASARVIIATTHNFDAGSVESIVGIAARLPAVTHLVVGESSLCTPRCKAVVGPCCCFVPLGSEEVPTHWGNSHLTFSLYQKVARWVLKADTAERVSDRKTLDALERGEIDLISSPTDAPIRKNSKGSEKKRAEVGHGRETKKKGKRRDGAGGASEASPASPSKTPPRASEANKETRGKMSPETAPSPVLATSPGVVGRLVRTAV